MEAEAEAGRDVCTVLLCLSIINAEASDAEDADARRLEGRKGESWGGTGIGMGAGDGEGLSIALTIFIVASVLDFSLER